MLDKIKFFYEDFVLIIQNFSFEPNYLQAGSIVVLIFLLIVSMANFRKHFVKWSLKGGFVGLFFGFVLALLLEGFLLVGGKTVVTELLGWKNAPKPIKNVLDLGKEKLVTVLGTSVENVGDKDIITSIQNLNPSEMNKIKDIICTP